MSIEKYIENYINKLIKVNNQLEHMDSVIRPRNNNNNPGGVVNLKNDIPTMIIPDLHNRLEFLNKILNYKPHNQTVKEDPLVSLF
ncbi:MAG: hypothetical protein B6229_03335 [Spirochaetaceae bacterium 4572_7]|nr:MAG: hypothetical protein B6229_03335 [Spirochaetaceae bacterium 4572_7]